MTMGDEMIVTPEHEQESMAEARASMLTEMVCLIQEMISELQEEKRDAEIEVLQDLEDRLRARYEL